MALINLTDDQVAAARYIIESYAEANGTGKDFAWWADMVELRKAFLIKPIKEEKLKPSERQKLLSDMGCTQCADFCKSCMGADKDKCKYNAEFSYKQ